MKTSIKTLIAHSAMDYVPHLIRQELLKDSEFRDEYELPTDATIVFDDVTIQLSKISNAVKKVLSDNSVEEVTDSNQKKWQVKNISPEGKLPNLFMYSDVKRKIPHSFNTLSPVKDTRLSSLELVSQSFNLPPIEMEKWRQILARRVLSNEEVFDFEDAVRFTPMNIARVLNSEISSGESPISSLVPHSRDYYDRLVGKYDGSRSVREYVTGSGRTLFCQLSEWQPYQGFLLSLLLSSHSLLTDEMKIDRLSCDELTRAYEFLVEQGDRISQLGAIEIGLRVLHEYPVLTQPVIHLIERIRDDDAEGRGSGFQLVSTLFSFVDGELARTMLLSDTPPFYRRLAALAQASLIHRQLVGASIDFDRFCALMPDDRRFQHFLQSLTDMRIEPSWDPRFAAASQIKSEFIGRILISADRFEDTLEKTSAGSLLYSEDEKSLRAYSKLLFSYLPGPLEGAEKTQVQLPSELADIIRKQLSSGPIQPSSFNALVNYGLVFGLGKELTCLAVDLLKTANYRLANVEDSEQLVATLYGLATVAAATRSTELTDAIRIVVRRYRSDANFTLSIQTVMNICIISAASHSDLDAWSEYVGGCMTEFALGELKNDDGLACYAYLIGICHAVPELWVSCGRADAALMAFNLN